MNKKGFTLVEIIVSISLISVVVIFLFQMIITIKNLNDNEVNKTNNQMAVAIITREVEKDLNSFGLEQDPSEVCDSTKTNIIPATAENIKCIKLIYQSVNVKNNEGYIIYYKNRNNNKYFLAYKRGKDNIIETQTVRELNITENTNVDISINQVAEDGMQSLKLVLPIRNNKDKYDLVINYFESDGSTKKQVNIYAEGGELIEKVGEGTYEKDSLVTIKYSYDSSSYFFEGLTCTNITCENKDLGTISFTMPNKNVNIKIKLKKKTLVNYLLNLYQPQNNQGLEVDDTDDHNLRYVGSSPKNYIKFNNETWRIIGVFNVYDVDSNANESLVKIIRNDSLGEYSWDTSVSSINSGWGINEWSQADLMTELNTDYLGTKSGTTIWYDGNNNLKSGSYDYSKNIKGTYIDKIANVRWNLGGLGGYLDVKNHYIFERGTYHVSDPSDGVVRKDNWDGKVALMYTSDFGYASTDTTCRKDLSSTNCKNNNWLFDKTDQWMLTPYFNNPGFSFAISSLGNASINNASAPNKVRPVIYLKSDVLITGGSGTFTSPYIIS